MKGFKIITLAVATAAAFSLSTITVAAIQVPSGWYIEANVGGTKSSNTSFGSGASVTTSGPSVNFNGGYKFMPFFAAELGLTKYADSKIKDGDGSTGGKDTNTSIDAALKGILPIGESGVEVFAKFGLMRITSKVTISDPATAAELGLSSGNRNVNGLYLGVGADWSWLPNMPINFQWARSRGNNTTGDLDLYSIGVAFIFG